MGRNRESQRGTQRPHPLAETRRETGLAGIRWDEIKKQKTKQNLKNDGKEEDMLSETDTQRNTEGKLRQRGA